MATVNISKIKFRRGTNSQRKTVIFDQGEPVYTIDTKRLYVGSGTDSGGFVVGNKNFTGVVNYYSLTTIPSEIGDMVHINNKFYQLTSVNYATINSWADVSARIDPIFFKYNSTNQITLNVDSISSAYLDSSTVLSGVKVQNGLLTLDLYTKSLAISSNKLYIKPFSIDEREISSSSLSSGLIGGSGSKIKLDIDTKYLTFSGNKLSILDAPVTFSDLLSSWFGGGLIYNALSSSISAAISSVDGTTIKLSSGVISINPNIFGSGLQYNTTTSKVSSFLTGLYNTTLTRAPSSGTIFVNPNMFGAGLSYNSTTDKVSLSVVAPSATKELPMITVDTFGRVINTQSAIFEIFECDSNVNPNINAYSALSGIFNGIPDPNMGHFSGSHGLPTVFPCISSDLVTTIYLSSAGFIAFQGNIGTRQDPADNIPRFAIPIFRF